MQKIVLFLTEPHSLVCRECIYSERVQTEQENRTYICHDTHAINTGDSCCSFKTLGKLLKELEKENEKTI